MIRMPWINKVIVLYYIVLYCIVNANAVLKFFSVSWPKSKTSLEMTVAIRIRLKQKEIEQSC